MTSSIYHFLLIVTTNWHDISFVSLLFVHRELFLSFYNFFFGILPNVDLSIPANTDYMLHFWAICIFWIKHAYDGSNFILLHFRISNLSFVLTFGILINIVCKNFGLIFPLDTFDLVFFELAWAEVTFINHIFFLWHIFRVNTPSFWFFIMINSLAYPLFVPLDLFFLVLQLCFETHDRVQLKEPWIFRNELSQRLTITKIPNFNRSIFTSRYQSPLSRVKSPSSYFLLKR